MTHLARLAGKTDLPSLLVFSSENGKRSCLKIDIS